MASHAAVFTQADIARALRAVVKAGLSPIGVRIGPSGGFQVLLGGGAETSTALAPLDEWRQRNGQG